MKRTRCPVAVLVIMLVLVQSASGKRHVLEQNSMENALEGHAGARKLSQLEQNQSEPGLLAAFLTSLNPNKNPEADDLNSNPFQNAIQVGIQRMVEDIQEGLKDAVTVRSIFVCFVNEHLVSTFGNISTHVTTYLGGHRGNGHLRWGNGHLKQIIHSCFRNLTNLLQYNCAHALCEHIP